MRNTPTQLITWILCLLSLWSLPVITAAEIAQNEPIVIGTSNAQKGPTQALGKNLNVGATVYFNKINAAGGIHGRKIKQIIYDDGYEPLQTIKNTAKLITEDNVFLLFNYVGTPTSKVAVPLAVHNKVPFITPFTGAEFLRFPVNPYVFNLRASYFNETQALVDHLIKVHKTNKIAAFIQNDGYGGTGREGINRALEKHGLKIAAVGKYQRNTVDISTGLETVLASNPQAIILIGAYQPCAAFMRAARAAGFTGIFANISFVGTQELIKAAGKAGEGSYISQVVPHPVESPLPLIEQYRQDMTTAGKADLINFGSLEGYLNAFMLTQALQQQAPPLTRERFMQTLEHFSLRKKGLSFLFTPDLHQGFHRIYLTQVKNGKAKMHKKEQD